MSGIYKNIKTEESKLSFDNLNMLSNNNPINSKETKKNCLFIRPLSFIEKNDSKLNDIIRSSFEDPSQYFAVNSPVQIGTRIKLKKMDLLSQNKNKRTIRSPSKKFNVSMKISVTDTSRSLYTIKEKSIQKNNLMLNKEIIDNNNLKKIFENYKSKICRNKNLRKNESSFSRSVKDINNSNSLYNRSKANTLNNDDVIPYDLFKSLNYQNKRITDDINYFKRNKYISKQLSKQLNKDEDDLLFNKVDLFKYKKEILSGLNKESLPEKFKWNISLRLPPNFKGKREYHINVNSERNPFWGVVVERYPHRKELSVKPGYNLRQKEFVKFSRELNNINKNRNNVNAIKNLDDLNVIGNNLFDMEYKREMSCDKNKILYKSFVDNGKIIMYKDVNSIYGHETFYKNYFGRNKKKYINQNLSGSQSMQDLRKNRLFKF